MQNTKSCSWLHCAPGGGYVLFYLSVLHILSIVGLLFFPLPSIQVLAAAALLGFLGALGTTVCYHRALTHRGVRLNPWVEQVLIFFAIFNGGSTPRGWVAAHRCHHAMADTPSDVSSPHFGGFWWAHIRWVWQTEPVPFERYCPELNRTKYIFWERIHYPILFLAGFFGLYWGLGAWIWLGPLRMLTMLHAQFCVNSICHLGDLENSVSKAKGSSMNVWWLTPFFFGIGENWHANHHEDQRNPRLGLTPMQIDFGWWTICVLRALRLAKLERH